MVKEKNQASMLDFYYSNLAPHEGQEPELCLYFFLQ